MYNAGSLLKKRPQENAIITSIPGAVDESLLEGPFVFFEDGGVAHL
jgi:hypothetical protein